MGSPLAFEGLREELWGLLSNAARCRVGGRDLSVIHRTLPRGGRLPAGRACHSSPIHRMGA